MAAGRFKVYDAAKEDILNGGAINLDTDTFKLALFTNASNANTLTHSQLSNLTNQVSGSGYPAGGVTLVNVTVSRSGGTVTFTADPAVFTADAGSITARFGVIYSDTATNKNLLCVCLLDAAPADVTVTDGNDLTITPAAEGIITISGATTD